MRIKEVGNRTPDGRRTLIFENVTDEDWRVLRDASDKQYKNTPPGVLDSLGVEIALEKFCIGCRYFKIHYREDTKVITCENLGLCDRLDRNLRKEKNNGTD